MSTTKTVLIIEDTLSLADILKDTIVQLTEHDAHTVFNYREALDYIRKNGVPDAITTDIFLDDPTDIPRSEFWNALRLLANQQGREESNIKVAIVSGGNGLTQQALEIERQYGFPTVTINKPLDQSELLAFVNSGSIEMQGLRQKLLQQYEAASVFPSLTIENAIKGLQPQVNDDGFLRSYPYPPALENAELVHGLKPEDILAVYSSQVEATAEQEANALFFDAGVGNAVSGQVVFDIKNAAALKSKNPDMPIILIGEQHAESVLRQSAYIDGAVNFSNEPIAHFSEIARNKGLSILTVTPQIAAESGIFFINRSIAYDGKVIEEGDIVTIDPNNNRLYLGDVSVSTPAKPDSFDVLQEALEGIRCPIRFSPQVETASGVLSANKNFDLSKMENYFQYKEGGVDIVNAYLIDPTSENLDRVKSFLKDYIREEIVVPSNGSTSQPSFRLVDFKPDEFIKTQEERDEIKRIHGIDDLRGTALATVLPDLYRVQVEAILEEIKPTYDTLGDPFDIGNGEMDQMIYPSNVTPYIIIPMVEDVSHYNMLQSLVKKAVNDVWGEDRSKQVSVVPMIETLSAVKILPELLPAPRVLIGGSDLMSDIMGGVSRSNEVAIKQWMDRNPMSEHPFRSIPQEMQDTLVQLVAIVDSNYKTALDEGRYDVDRTDVYFCGVQAQHLSALETLSKTGIHNVTVPADDYHLEGLPIALRVAIGAKEIVGELDILEQQNRMSRRAEYS